MARVLHNLFFCLIRLALKIRLWGYWSLIYGYCALCAVVALLKLWWSIVLRPTATFQWVIRESPPACLNDTSLGTHCYVRIKVRRTHLIHSSLLCLHWVWQAKGIINRLDEQRFACHTSAPFAARRDEPGAPQVLS